ncbi:hypothetical protein D5R81_04365 [Parashewanella spongiae]|uniref:Uncharacterized protein n=1 Tax=Parashewanella spongiae TaxID=342950 RepID=A0A3A6ULR5_9GAMM|nr:hypothetical protein [Parashewanella spongiae]MCL1077510.1 hypothetical protein [Parashewanella spongiae]RJY18633.1 hypothetical protein D5R81_04365 [Parashewanella spongiae]
MSVFQPASGVVAKQEQSWLSSSTKKRLLTACNETYFLAAKQSKKMIKFFADSTNETAYKVSVGATTGLLVGSVGGPGGAAAGAVAGGTIAAGHIALKSGVKLMLSPFLSDKTAELVADSTVFLSATGSTYAATGSVVRSTLSVGLGFAGKKVSDKVAKPEETHPVLKAATDATCAAIGCLTGHIAGQAFDRFSTKPETEKYPNTPNHPNHPRHARATRQASNPPSQDCASRPDEPTVVNHNDTLDVNGTNGRCGHYRVGANPPSNLGSGSGGGILNLHDTAGEGAKIDIGNGSSVNANDKSLKKGTVRVKDSNNQVVLNDDAGEEVQSNENGDFNYVELNGNAGRDSQFDIDGNFNDVDINNGAGQGAQLEVEGDYNDVYMNDNAGEGAQLEIEGDQNDVKIYENGNEGGQIEVEGINNDIFLYDNAGEGEQLEIEGDYNEVRLYDSVGEDAHLALEGDFNLLEMGTNAGNEARFEVEGEANGVRMLQNAAEEAHLTLEGDNNLVDIRDSAGDESQINLDGRNNVIDLRGNGGRKAKINLTSNTTADSTNSTDLTNSTSSANETSQPSTMTTYGRSGFKAEVNIGENGHLIANDNSLNRASVTVQKQAEFTALDDSCNKCTVTASGGTIKLNSTTALKGAKVIICNNGRLLDRNGRLLNRDNVEDGTLIQSLIDKGANLDSKCMPVPVPVSAPVVPVSFPESGKIAVGVLVPLSVVVLVATPTGIIMYVKRNEVKKCCALLKKHKYIFSKDKLSAKPPKQTHGKSTDLVAVHVELEATTKETKETKPKKPESKKSESKKSESKKSEPKKSEPKKSEPKETTPSVSSVALDSFYVIIDM